MPNGHYWSHGPEGRPAPPGIVSAVAGTPSSARSHDTAAQVVEVVDRWRFMMCSGRGQAAGVGSIVRLGLGPGAKTILRDGDSGRGSESSLG